MKPTGAAKRIGIEMNDISGPWTKKGLWSKKAINWTV
jgi:hypothetical protein